MKSNRIFTIALIHLVFLSFWVTTGFAAMELPAKLSQVPVFLGSKIIQVMDMGENSMAALEVKADRDALMKFYKDEMQGKGWKTAGEGCSAMVSDALPRGGPSHRRWPLGERALWVRCPWLIR